jgi:hypothetical protein
MLNAMFIDCLLSHILIWLNNEWKWSAKEIEVISFKALPDADAIVNVLSKFNQNCGQFLKLGVC